MPTTPHDMRYLNRISLKKYYENSRNSIEDPLFTGFTLDIDQLHSPLFYALAGDEYNKSESLRSSEGTNVDLAKSIEEKLNNVYKLHVYGSPNSYEINTLYTKDTLGDRRAGYGLQDKYYIDNVLYGAVDYIYMVDKVASGIFTDDYGVSDIGNGTAVSSVYDEYNNDIESSQALQQALSDMNEQLTNATIDDETGELIIDYDLTAEQLSPKEALNREIEQRENGITEEDKAQHEENEKACKKAKEAVDEKLKEYKKIQDDIDALEKSINDDMRKVLDDLDKLKQDMTKYQSELKSNGGKEDTRNNIEKKYKEYETFIDENNLKTNFKNIEVTPYKPTDEVINSEINGLSTSERKDENHFRNIFRVLKTTITERNVTQEIKNIRQEKLEDKKQLEKELYGIDAEDRIGSEVSPVEPSLYYTYNKAKNEMDNDIYSQKNYDIYKLKNASDNLEDVQKYNAIQAAKKQITKNLPSSDFTGNKETKTEIFEVPQTVYDMMGFINGMKDIITKYPYVLQSITGLDEAYKKYFGIKDPYMGSGDDKITIECLEFLDMRVSSMFNKYFNAVYDRQYRRERVPVNLRRFNCSVFVHDIRNFKDSLNGDKFVEGVDLSTIAEMALNYVSVVEFKFYDCEIVPDETGDIFDSISNIPSSEMKKTNFTFTYGNCVINFLPFEDLRKYLLNQDIEKIKPKTVTTTISSTDDSFSGIIDNGVDGNFRRWFDKSPLGNVNNNDYRDYIRHDSAVAVDDHYKTTIVNNFAMNSVVEKNQQLTAMDDALRRIVTGISASTGIPVPGVTDALNIKFIDPIINEKDKAAPVVKDLGNVTNSKVVDENTMEYIGQVIDSEKQEPTVVKNLGNINNPEKGGK